MCTKHGHTWIIEKLCCYIGTFTNGKILSVLAAELLQKLFDKVPDVEVVGKDNGVEDQMIGKLSPAIIPVVANKDWSGTGLSGYRIYIG